MVPKRFRIFGVSGSYRNPPGKLMGLMGHSGEEEAGHKRWRPPCPIQIGQGVGGVAPLSFSLSPSFPFPLSVGRKGGTD